MTKCKCSKACTAQVKMKGRKYARGHSPAFRQRDRFAPEAKTMSAVDYEAYKKKLREAHGPYASEKIIKPCPNGCGYEDGVRALQRHRKDCPKRRSAGA
jgi:hypothetical protein